MTFFVELDGNEPEVSGAQPEPLPPSPEPQPGVGQVLKARRLELGLKHKDISRDTKIRVEYLKAIENEEFDLLPTPQYLRLFLKSYADHLGLDVQEIYGLYDTRELPLGKLEKKEPGKEKEPGREKEPAPPPVVSQPKAGAYTWAIGIGAVVILVVVVFLVTAKRRGAQVESEPEPIPVGAVIDPDASLVGGGVDTLLSSTPLRHQLDLRAVDSVWMVIEADDDTVFNGILGPGEVKTWTAENVFRFSLSSYTNAEARFDGRYLRPFVTWARPIQRHEVGAFNLDQYLDSSRLAAGP